MLVLTHQEPENSFFSPTVYLIEGIYCAAGFFWARHLFLSAQDVPWTGGQVYLQGGRTLWPAWLAFRVKKKENRWIALIKKELQLQEVVIFLIPVLAALHVIVLGISHFLKGHTKQWMAMSMPIIWMASVPFLIGCVAVAEERRLNTLEGLLCMPRLSKRASFATKLIISLVLGGVLGGAVPPFLENRSIHMHMDASMAIAVIVTGITFYASTMSKGLLQAIPAAMCIAGLMFGEFALCLKFLVFEEDQIQLTSFDLLNSLWIPAMACTAILLGYQNYRCPQISPWMWLRNFLVASAVYGCAVAAAIGIYARPWEFLMALEPAHGPARLADVRGVIKGDATGRLCVLLSDGRLWLGRQNLQSHGVSGAFLPGSNWTQMAIGDSKGPVALKSDGTLWRIHNRSDFREIGIDSDWKDLTGGFGAFLALKQNGTLWGWGKDAFNMLAAGPTFGNVFADPVRLGRDSDWVKAFLPQYCQCVGVKRDGSMWKWGYGRYDKAGKGVKSRPVEESIRWNLAGTNWISLSKSWYSNLILGVRADGTLWAEGDHPAKLLGQVVPGGRDELVRVGDKSDWVEVNGSRPCVALESNGTLWAGTLWARGGAETKQPSKYQDWLASANINGMTCALARDGTITLWNEFNNEADNGRLAPSRKAVAWGNIFAAQ